MTTRNLKVVRRELTTVSVARALRILRDERRFTSDMLAPDDLQRLCGHIQALSSWQRHRSPWSRDACFDAVRSAAAINSAYPYFCGYAIRNTCDSSAPPTSVATRCCARDWSRARRSRFDWRASWHFRQSRKEFLTADRRTVCSGSWALHASQLGSATS